MRAATMKKWQQIIERSSNKAIDMFYPIERRGERGGKGRVEREKTKERSMKDSKDTAGQQMPRRA